MWRRLCRREGQQLKDAGQRSPFLEHRGEAGRGLVETRSPVQLDRGKPRPKAATQKEVYC